MTAPNRLPPQTEPPLSPRQTLPTMYDLPSEDPEEPGVPDEFHIHQPQLLRETFQPSNCDPDEIFIGTDINLYYDVRHFNWYKRPDWFAAIGVDRLYEGHDLRWSYVTWQEGISPFIAIELLSPNTENEDLGRTVSKRGQPPTKWKVYEKILRVPYYIVFSRYTNEWQAFHNVAGEYQPVELTDGWLLIPQLELRLGLWQGQFQNIDRLWLRWFTLDGELLLTESEKAAAAEVRATAAEVRATEAEERAERLAAKLRELNIDPDELG